MGMVKQYEVYWIDLEPAQGSEIKKVRPCVIVTPNEMNDYLNTVIVAPLTSTLKQVYPFRGEVIISNKKGWTALDQLRCIDKSRIKGKLGSLSKDEIQRIKNILFEMLIK
jgi:mRNA interferase MazF